MTRTLSRLFLFCCALSANAMAGVCDATPAGQAPPEGAAAPSPAGSGQVVIIDPDTGRRTSDASKAPQLAPAPADLARYQQAYDNVRVVVNPDGSATADISGLPKTPLAAEVEDGHIVTCHAPDDPAPAE